VTSSWFLIPHWTTMRGQPHIEDDTWLQSAAATPNAHVLSKRFEISRQSIDRAGSTKGDFLYLMCVQLFLCIIKYLAMKVHVWCQVYLRAPLILPLDGASHWLGVTQSRSGCCPLLLTKRWKLCPPAQSTGVYTWMGRTVLYKVFWSVLCSSVTLYLPLCP